MKSHHAIGLLTVITWVLLITPGSAASQDKSGAEEPVGVVEEAEVVESVEAVDSVDGSVSEGPSFSLLQIVGRNHAAAVHIPIGLIMGVLLIELLGLFFPRVPLGKSGLVLSLATVASFIPASISGWMRSNELFANSEAPSLFFEHRNLMIAALFLFTVSVVLRVAKKDALEGVARWLYLGLLLISVALIAAGGHHGGQLVYGEHFLPY